MGWANHYIEKLKAGETVSFRPRGNSMTPIINSGDLVTVAPVKKYHVGDVVLCKVNGNQYLHKITAIRGSSYQISNNHGHINGWTSANQIYGVMISAEH